MTRNLGNVWSKYPQYNEENTIMVSPFYNMIPDFQRNDIVIPEFNPFGQTDFQSDLHLSYVELYLKFLLSLRDVIGSDVRQRMDGCDYQLFLQRSTKKIKTDSYAYMNESDMF